VVSIVGLNTAAWVPGTAGHSWQAVAAGGMSIGHKGTFLAAWLFVDEIEQFICLSFIKIFCGEDSGYRASRCETDIVFGVGEQLGPDVFNQNGFSWAIVKA